MEIAVYNTSNQHEGFQVDVVMKSSIISFQGKAEKSNCKAEEAKEVLIFGQIPPIEKMDDSLSTLANCE
jgi:hypothetical protein